jgi:galactose mutarotase-like enzyme
MGEMKPSRHTIGNNQITVTIKSDGAELCSLKNAAGVELLWQAGPAWPRHAPILFPIVGRLKNDELRHQGKIYPMTQHGFARDQRFEWTGQEPHSCSLLLQDSTASRSRYPFAFRLVVTYTVHDARLDVMFALSNTGDVVLPASMGAHPAFNWPLAAGTPKESYTVAFSNEENAPVRRLKDGLLRAGPEPTPIAGKILSLSERLFDDDAVILDRPASTAVRYAAATGPAIEVSWQGFRELGLWSKPGGAAFLCIEPWRGFASPAEFDGDFADKPGLMHLAPGETQRLTYQIGVSV